MLTVFRAAERVPPMYERIAATVLDLWHEKQGWGDPWNNMAALAILGQTVQDTGSLGKKASELALETAKLLAPTQSGVPSARKAFVSLADTVTRLEGLRAASMLTDHPALAPCREWQSAWDPGLWQCKW